MHYPLNYQLLLLIKFIQLQSIHTRASTKAMNHQNLHSANNKKHVKLHSPSNKNHVIAVQHQSQTKHNQSNNSQSLSNTQQQIQSLQQQIQCTLLNYEQLLQIQNANQSQRSELLLYIIQTTRTRHAQELQALQQQLNHALLQREEAENLENQMHNIGQGVDSIVEQGKLLKLQNQALLKELEDQDKREKEIDEEIETCSEELNQSRMKVDEWERMKLKWNRRKKEIVEMIEETEKDMNGINNLPLSIEEQYEFLLQD